MLRGNCLCNAVVYEITGPVGEAHHCHCGVCRKSHAAAFSTFCQVARADFRFTQGEEHVRRFQSSPPCQRTFCDTCGSHLQFFFDGLPDALWVSAATLDDATAVRPGGHMFVRSKAPWHEIGDELPRFDEYPRAAYQSQAQLRTVTAAFEITGASRSLAFACKRIVSPSRQYDVT